MAYINNKDLEFVIQMLVDRDPVEGESLHDALTIMRKVRSKVASQAEIELARDRYANPSGDSIEIDDEGVGIAEADDGVWINAWVWLPTAASDEADPSEDDDSLIDEPAHVPGLNDALAPEWPVPTGGE